MDFAELINKITPTIHQQLKQAVEIGKWPDGSKLSTEQKELSLQAIIGYEQRHLSETQRVGYIDRGHKQLGETCSSTDSANNENADVPLKWS